MIFIFLKLGSDTEQGVLLKHLKWSRPKCMYKICSKIQRD